LKIAPFEGWTRLTLKRAVRDAGYPEGVDELYFEQGVADLLTHWSDQLNAQAEAEMRALDLDQMKIRERVTQGVLKRLEAIGRHEEAARRASSRLVLPDLASTGVKQGDWRHVYGCKLLFQTRNTVFCHWRDPACLAVRSIR